jgi:hypothetical protein
LKTFFVNVAVLVGLLFLVEGSTWSFLAVWDARIQSRGTSDVSEKIPTIHSSPQVAIDAKAFNARQGGFSPYRYGGVLGYAVRPFNSATLNTDDQGLRARSADLPIPSGKVITIWMLGSSALFGLHLADDETIPAVIERSLNIKYDEATFVVRNFGTDGYSSTQDLIQFKYQLLSDPPDLVITYNGLNDHWYALTFDSPRKVILWPGRNGEIMDFFWDFHEKNQLINTSAVGKTILGPFPNTVEFFSRASRKMTYLGLRSNLDEWKDDYMADHRIALEKAQVNVPLATKSFLQNSEYIALMAAAEGAKVILVQQPILLRSKKIPVTNEAVEIRALRANFFSVNDQEILDMTEFDSWETTRLYNWDEEYFVSTYSSQNDALAEIARQVGAGFIDAQKIVDRSGDLHVFTSLMHYTRLGAAYIADGMMPTIEAQVDLLLEGK